ncbi:cation diffusion facilitator family transporter [Myxococcota bacterium]|nr:cation diffusion facilitator family transporter [Myxococcota bacterium]
MSAPPTSTAPLSGQAQRRLLHLASLTSILVAVALIFAKLTAWALTDSVSLLATLGDSVLDASASLINFFAIRHALQPADEEHRFGHGKAEALAGLAQAAFITGSAVFLLLQAAERLIHPRPLNQPGVGIWVMSLSIVMTLGLVLFQRFVVRRTGSTAIQADSLHYQGDLLMNASVLISILIVDRWGWTIIDPIAAVLIAGIILKSVAEIARLSLDVLMDRELPELERQAVREVALACAGVEGIHDLRTRRAGLCVFVEIHVEMQPEISLRKAHHIADAVIRAIKGLHEEVEVLVHQDPLGVEEPQLPFDN